ncbi:hypothetical protein M405DRAFT_868381 [Rhizopogon salebrosus TDB-379]|nr:hypothetical protein M405DRAFT_868381 [Rhizopogon salebrosus TDB-379]
MHAPPNVTPTPLKRPSISQPHLLDQAGPPSAFPRSLSASTSTSLNTIGKPSIDGNRNAVLSIPSRARVISETSVATSSQKHRASPVINFTSPSPSKHKNTPSASIRMRTSSVASILVSIRLRETPQPSKGSSTLPSPASSNAPSKPHNSPTKPTTTHQKSRQLPPSHPLSLMHSPSVRHLSLCKLKPSLAKSESQFSALKPGLRQRTRRVIVNSHEELLVVNSNDDTIDVWDDGTLDMVTDTDSTKLLSYKRLLDRAHASSAA